MATDLGIPGIEDAEEVGRGAFGVVYRARQPALDRVVAVKVLTGGLDDAARARFDRERKAMGALSTHSNIVAVHDTGVTADGRPYIVMQYAASGSLADRIASDGAMEWHEVVKLGTKLADALAAAHAAGVLHRDIKPENVLLSEYGEPMLADFGIARIAGGPQTRTGVVTASVAHAPPEILEGKPPSEASDVYGLASTLFALLQGRAPFMRVTDESMIPVIARIATDPPPDLRPVGVPDAVAAVLERGLAKNPADRYASAAEFATALRDAESAPAGSIGAAPPAPPIPPVAAPPTREPVPAAAPRKKRKGAFLALVVVVALLAGVGAVVAAGGGGTDAPSEIEVPSVIGLIFGDAQTVLEDAGFRVSRVDVVNDATIGEVFDQNPNAGQLLAKKRTVVLKVSALTVTIPDLTGKTFQQAQQKLAKLGLVATRVDVASSTADPDTVLGTFPVAGTKVDKGTTVGVSVAVEEVTVPDVSNQPQAQAQTNLQNLGFVVQITAASSNSVPAGTVIGTFPAAGTKLAKGDTVVIIVSTGAAPVPVPAVVGLDEATASGALVAAGFTPSNTCAPLAIVVSQSPTAGSPAAPGTTVTITC